MREGRNDANDGNVALEAESSGRGARSKFEEQLDKLEAVLSGSGGPFIMGYGNSITFPWSDKACRP